MRKLKLPTSVSRNGQWLNIHDATSDKIINCYKCATAEEAVARIAVLDEALSWHGTPYCHRGGLKGKGADCLMFVVRVFENCGIIPKQDIKPYPQDWHMHRGEGLYEAGVRRYARLIDADDAKPGDIVLWKFGRAYAHGAIIFHGWPSIIHAYGIARQVILDEGNGGYVAERPRLMFTPW